MIFNNNSKSLYLAPLLLIIGIASFVSLYANRKQSEIKLPSEKHWPVEIEIIKLASHQPEAQLFGLVKNPTKSQLTAPYGARVNKVSVNEGDTVTKGQLLIELEHEFLALTVARYQAELDEIDARINAEKLQYNSNSSSLKHEKKLLNIMQRRHNRQIVLQEKNLGSRANIDQAAELIQLRMISLKNKEFDVAGHTSQEAILKAQRTQINVQLKEAEIHLQEARITAPFNGVINRIEAAPGEWNPQGSLLLETYPPQDSICRVLIPEIYLGKIKKALAQNQSIKALARSGPEEWTMSLKRLAVQIEKDQGGVEGLFTIEGNNPPEIGRRLEVLLALPETVKTAAIPEQAIYRGNIIFILDEGQMHSITIDKLGILSRVKGKERRVLVHSKHIHDGLQLITSHLSNAASGLAVIAISAPPE